MYNLITYSLALHLCFNTQRNFKKQFIRSIEGISRSIKMFNKFISKFLDDSIDSRFIFNQSKGKSDRSKGIFDRSKNWRKLSQSLELTRSILNSCLIDRKGHSINRREFSIDRNSRNCISNFTSNCFWRFIWTKHSFLITSEWDWDQNWISLML